VKRAAVQDMIKTGGSMDTIYGTVIAFAAPVFLIAVTIEALIDRARGTKYYNLADAIVGVGCGTAFIGARISFGFIGLFVYNLVLEHAAPIRLPATHWLTWIFAFVFYDFCYYWWHRLSHNVAFLWGAHVVHHQSEEFNLTTALRQPASGFLTAWIFFIPLAFCGVPLSVYLTVGVAQLLYQFWPHTQHIRKLGVLERWIQTPSNHRVHHARNSVYINKNYVGVFLIWDRLFGTYEEEHDDVPCDYGITENVSAWNPVWANLHFYWRLASQSWKTRSWRDKIRVWFAEPGWMPSDLAEPEGTRSAPIRRTKWMAIYALVQFAAVIGINQHFLTIFATRTMLENALYFGIVLTGLTTVSIVLEGRLELFGLEMARLGAVAAIVIGSGEWFGVKNSAVVSTILFFTLASMIWFGVLWGRKAPMKLRPDLLQDL
jgi:sterol desaturase/sphingolipid hydroxylase (fatty acid hydroxylase superfamily)